MILLGIGSKARSGKDTVGEAIVNHINTCRNAQIKHGGSLIKSVYHRTYPNGPTYPEAGLFKFASALYDECRTLHGMTEKDAPLLQRIGSERRSKDPDYWIKKLFADIPTGIGIAVITDLRYQNEASAIKERGGFTARVDRLNQDGTRYVADDRPADHQSEIDLDGYNFDYYIKAKSGEVAWTEQQAITLIEYILGLS